MGDGLVGLGAVTVSALVEPVPDGLLLEGDARFHQDDRVLHKLPGDGAEVGGGRQLSALP